MVSYMSQINMSNLLTGIIATVIVSIVYTALLTVYRLYFSPISHIPGPKLAAATWWYEFYFQVVKGGQFYKEIAKLHKQYGPIVRITPVEVHIDDPEFYDTIYPLSERRDKVPWHKNAFTSDKSAFATSDHDLHRTRRGTLNPYFSKAQIRKFAPWIQDRANTLCRRFEEEYKGKDKVVALNHAFACLTADAVMEYSFAENYNLIETPGLVADLNTVLEVYLRAIHIATNFPFLVQLQIFYAPRWLVTWLDPASKIILSWQDDIERQIDAIMNGSNQKNQDADHATIFHEILQSKRPPQEKSKQRLFDEAQTIVSAGVETTAWTISVAIFYLLNNKDSLNRLREELKGIWPNISSPPDLATLESLPYLTAVAHEGLRLAYGGAARLPRISPDKDIPYTTPSGDKLWILPHGTPISSSSIIMHHNETVYPESHTFAPERWLAEPPEHLRAPILAGQPDKPLSRFLVSFNKGSRSCLGMQLAWAEIYITIANVVRKTNLELYETGIADVVPDREFLLARPKEGSLGIRVKVV